MAETLDTVDVGLALSRNAERYLEFLLWTVSVTAREPQRFRYVLGINHDCDIDRVRAVVSVAGVEADVFEARIDTGYGSMNHGMCLDAVFQRMASKHGMLLDCDLAFLHRGWDEMLLRTVRYGNVITGAEYDGEKYLGFPNVICAAFDVGVIRSLGVSFRPEGRVSLSGDDLGVYGYPMGEPVSILLDTGSELPRKVKGAGFRGLPLPLFRAGHPDAKFMTGDTRGEEYQLNGRPIVTHLGRSYTREFGIDPHAIAWEARVREWLHAT